MLIRFSNAVGKEIFGDAALAMFVYFPDKPWTDFDGAGLIAEALENSAVWGPYAASLDISDRHAARQMKF